MKIMNRYEKWMYGREKGDRMRRTGENSRVSSQHNRGLILRLIATGRCHSRIELARETKLTKMTITNIVAEFRRNHILEEAEERPNDIRGRNPITVKVAPEAPKVIGVLIGKTYCETVLCDLNLQILEREKKTFGSELTESALIENICHLIDQMLQKEQKILGIGIASIGPIDGTRGTILNPSDFYGIQNVEVTEALRNRYDYPVFMDRDGNSAALAEALYGEGKEDHDFIYLGIADEINSAVITEGELFRNRKGYAPEIGHVCINPHGNSCICGHHGCLQAYAGSGVVLEKLKSATGENRTFEEFCSHVSEGKTDQILKEMMEDLSVALVSSINLLHPESILIGEEGVYLPDQYLEYLECNINANKFIQGQSDIAVKRAGFRKDARLLGAACNVILEVFNGNIPFQAETE